MAKHRAVHAAASRWLPGAAVAVVAAVIATVLLRPDGQDPPRGAGSPRPTASVTSPAAPCAVVRVVAASSFQPMLESVASQVGQGPDCVQLKTMYADGRAAAAALAIYKANVWIPDDSTWSSSVADVKLATDAAGAGAVLATSPLYMVSDAATGARLRTAGGSWAALAKLVDQRVLRLVVRDPAGSGDGLIGTGAAAEAVWKGQGMDASALWLSRARGRTRTAVTARETLQLKAGEVGLVPEYALAAAPTAGLSVLPGTDFAATLRYTWLPIAAGAADAKRLAGLKRLQAALSGPGAAEARAGARLRDAKGAAVTDGGAALLSTKLAKPLPVLDGHHVDHLFATWYPGDRRTDALIVVDVSGSMGEPAPGSTTPLIVLVREGVRSLGGLLPNDARLGLWEFGARIEGRRDYRQLLREAVLDAGQRRALARALATLSARRTGTGLHDTILAAYTSARDSFRPGVPNQVMVFTDGLNQDDPGGLTAAQLAVRLRAVRDPKRPVQLSVVAFGDRQAAEVIGAAVKPVDGYVDLLTTPDEVGAVFIHVAAGGLHH
ncbi:hypothetical protein GCM10009789_54720 [Kribbella sancticallisti]|uniref:VWFA domain-containing protein n=1 Tax=Kribbella sancticallisti TaxID=460087 RepID=A0ABN2E4F8_9ACTN